jgi:hypothetical protein
MNATRPEALFFGGRNIDPPHTKRFRYQKVRSNKVSFPHQWDAEEDGVDFFNFLFKKKEEKGTSVHQRFIGRGEIGEGKNGEEEEEENETVRNR